MLRTQTLATAAIAVLLTLGVGSDDVAAQSKYPDRLLTMIVPYGPGGTNDTVARMIAEQLPKYLGQPVVVENVQGGSNGSIGTGKVAAAKADGYTLLYAAPDNITVEPNVAKYSWDYRAFTPLVRVGVQPVYLVAGPGAKATTVKELVTYARANPDTVSVAVSGIASPSELGARRMFDAMGGVPVQYVPFKGGAQITTALLGGHIDMTLLPEGGVKQLMLTGKGKGVMALSKKSTASFPALPGIEELGLSVQPYEQWGMVFVPTGTPQPVVDQLRKAIAEIVNEPAFVAKLREAGITPAALASGPELEAILAHESDSFARVIKQYNLQR